jgi:hypothetical protein
MELKLSIFIRVVLLGGVDLHSIQIQFSVSSLTAEVVQYMKMFVQINDDSHGRDSENSRDFHV